MIKIRKNASANYISWALSYGLNPELVKAAKTFLKKYGKKVDISYTTRKGKNKAVVYKYKKNLFSID